MRRRTPLRHNLAATNQYLMRSLQPFPRFCRFFRVVFGEYKKILFDLLTYLLLIVLDYRGSTYGKAALKKNDDFLFSYETPRQNRQNQLSTGWASLND